MTEELTFKAEAAAEYDRAMSQASTLWHLTWSVNARNWARPSDALVITPNVASAKLSTLLA